MHLLRRYICSTEAGVVRYYAVVELDDLSTLELGDTRPLSDEEALRLAEIAVATPPEPEPTIEVEAENGRIV